MSYFTKQNAQQDSIENSVLTEDERIWTAEESHLFPGIIEIYSAQSGHHHKFLASEKQKASDWAGTWRRDLSLINPLLKREDHVIKN